MPGKCGRCGQNVFAAEERLALSKHYHIRCFTCAICSRTLDSYNLAENRELNEIFCKACYRLNFATKGYGYGGLEPTLLALPSVCTFPPSGEPRDDTPSQEGQIRPSTPKPTDSTIMTTPQQTRTNVLATSLKASNVLNSRQQSKMQTSTPRVPQTMVRPSHNQSVRDTLTHPLQSGQPSVRETLTHPQSNNLSMRETMTHLLQSNPSVRKTVVHPVGSRQNSCPGNCQGPPLPRYPAKHLEVHRIPLNADSFKHGGKSGGSTKGITKSHLGGGEPCRRCHKPVYWAEMKSGYHGVYHQECFSCCCCGKPLESTTVSENQGEIFCKGCYRRFFGTHGIGFGLGAGVLQTP